MLTRLPVGLRPNGALGMCAGAHGRLLRARRNAPVKQSRPTSRSDSDWNPGKPATRYSRTSCTTWQSASSASRATYRKQVAHLIRVASHRIDQAEPARKATGRILGDLQRLPCRLKSERSAASRLISPRAPSTSRRMISATGRISSIPPTPCPAGMHVRAGSTGSSPKESTHPTPLPRSSVANVRRKGGGPGRRRRAALIGRVPPYCVGRRMISPGLRPMLPIAFRALGLTRGSSLPNAVCTWHAHTLRGSSEPAFRLRAHHPTAGETWRSSWIPADATDSHDQDWRWTPTG